MENNKVIFDDIELNKCRKNIKIYTKYKMFAYDFLFYYAISVVYFTTMKNFSTSQVMYMTAFYTFSVFFWQITANIIIEKIGIKKSISLGNLLVCITSLSYLISPNFELILLGDFFGALGFTLKSLAEGTLCYSSLKNLGKKSEFTKIEGKSNSKYYYYDAVASFLSGFLFLINGYLPIILCFLNSIISFFISLKFQNVKSSYKAYNTKKDNFKIKDMIKQFKIIAKGKRSRSIFLYSFFFMGIISVTGNLYKLMLMEFGIETQYLTMIVCLFTILVGVGTKFLFKIESKTKNKTLTVFAYVYIIALIIISVVGKNVDLNIYSLIVVMMCLAVLGFIQGAYRVAIKKYVLNFTNSGMRTKITSLYYMSENLGSAFLLFISGIVLEYMSVFNASLIFSLFSLIIMTCIIIYISGKIGLKPEEYDPSEINNTKV